MRSVAGSQWSSAQGRSHKAAPGAQVAPGTGPGGNTKEGAMGGRQLRP